jgi:hypothetical protein
MSSDYELGPESSYGRDVHHTGRNIGTIYTVISADDPNGLEYMALIRILTTKGQLVAKVLGQYPTVGEAFHSIVRSHSG